MSGTVRTDGAVSIPDSVRKHIQGIKEITGNHSDEEIYATLKECNMDPDMTVQRLFSEEPFHEVKRKRDKRKEQNQRDYRITMSRPSNHNRGGSGLRRGNYLGHNSYDAGGYNSYDTGGGRRPNIWKSKPPNQNVVRSPGIICTSTDTISTTEVSSSPSSKFHKSMEELKFRDGEHLIIPSHLKVTEEQLRGLCFGSFDSKTMFPARL